MRAPVDFNSKDFYLRRRDIIDPILERLQRNELLCILKERESIKDYCIRGVDWSSISYEDVLRIAKQIPASAIYAVFSVLLLYPESCYRGLPDCIILPGAACSLPNSHPKELNSEFYFIEIKSAQDSISVYQKVWFHHLISYNQRVEIWKLG